MQVAGAEWRLSQGESGSYSREANYEDRDLWSRGRQIECRDARIVFARQGTLKFVGDFMESNDVRLDCCELQRARRGAWGREGARFCRPISRAEIQSKLQEAKLPPSRGPWYHGDLGGQSHQHCIWQCIPDPIEGVSTYVVYMVRVPRLTNKMPDL